MDSLYKKFKHNLEKILHEVNTPCGWVTVAVSGGVDSVSLLYCLTQFFKDSQTKIHVITFDHGLREQSKEEVQYVESLAKKFNATCSIVPLSFSSNKFTQKLARLKRIEKINSLKRGKLVFLGHHFDDQLETVMLRLQKNSGFLGLAGMSFIAHQPYLTIRPFLNIKKEEIIANAKNNNWKWFEDSSNQDLKYTRNSLRQQISIDKELSEHINMIQQNCSIWRQIFYKKMKIWYKNNTDQTDGKINFTINDLEEVIQELTPYFTTMQNNCMEAINYVKSNNLNLKKAQNYIGAITLQYIINNFSCFKMERLRKYEYAYANMRNRDKFTISHHIITKKNNLLTINREVNKTHSLHHLA